MSVVALERGLGPLKDVATHWMLSASEGKATDGPELEVVRALNLLSLTPGGTIASNAIIVAYLNQQIEKTSTVWMLSESGGITNEYVSSKPLKEMIAGLMKG